MAEPIDFIPSYFKPDDKDHLLSWQRLETTENMEVFQVVERDETPEEFEERKRVEEEEKKKAKKQAKKDDIPVEEVLKKVKQCVQSNIKMSGVQPMMSRWIASCF